MQWPSGIIGESLSRRLAQCAIKLELKDAGHKIPVKYERKLISLYHACIIMSFSYTEELLRNFEKRRRPDDKNSRLQSQINEVSSFLRRAYNLTVYLNYFTTYGLISAALISLIGQVGETCRLAKLAFDPNLSY